MTGDGNHTSVGGYRVLSGKLEQGHEVTAESFNECQIILSVTSGLREANGALS